jgi:hypothetical protein
MLLTDGSPNDEESLRVYESAILQVSDSELIPLRAKLHLALEEISEDVLNTLLAHSAPTDPQGTRRRTLGVSDVVVTPQMRRWHAARTLQVFYRDAFNNQLNSRYQAKFTEYRELSQEARDKTYQFGIGLVLSPIPRAQMPVFSFVAGPIAETTYYTQTSWVSANGQEGDPSQVTTYDSPAASLPVVTALNAPTVARGFNVYMGLSAETVSLQNATPISPGGSFTLPSSGLTVGSRPGCGQTANLYITGGLMLRRG